VRKHRAVGKHEKRLEDDSSMPSQTKPRHWGAQDRALLTRAEAAHYLALSIRRLEGVSSIPKVNVAPPESRRPSWRYEPTALDKWVAQHRAESED